VAGSWQRPTLVCLISALSRSLPFLNMTGDPEQEYFADGIVDEIITANLACALAFVIARNSGLTYKGRAVA
jgi:TolB-like protein